ncbi:MAG TPA: hypothetical protein VGN13_06640 [Solirubrobacteraceae bacterium]|jgi:hypothetical protein
MQFRIRRHSGAGAPPDALGLLWRQLEGRRFEDVVFSHRGSEVEASSGHDSPISLERDEREQLARTEVLDCLREICDGVPELRFDWFAVSPHR